MIRGSRFSCLMMLVAMVILLASSAASARVSAAPRRSVGSYVATAAQTANRGHGTRRLADVSGTIIAGGAPQTVTVGVAGDKARITFDGVASSRISLNITNVSVPFSYVSIQKPNGGGDLVSPTAVFTNGKFIDVVTLPTSGVYTIYINPQSNGTGSLTLTLYDVPQDVAGNLTPSQSGDVLSPGTSTPGQNARLTFVGATGQRVSLKISGVTLSSGGTFETVSIVKPDGSTLAGSGLVQSSGWIDTQILPSAGTYTVLVDPDTATTSTSTIRVYDVPPDISASIDPESADAVGETTTVPGQDARLTFAGTAGQTVYIPRGGVTISGSQIRLLKPDGSQLAGTAVLGAGESTLSATLPTTGTYTVRVDGFQDAVGSTTLAVSDEDAIIGGLAAEQPSVDLIEPDTPASPVPVSPSGPLAPGSYSTELWTSDEVGNENGLNVVSTTAPGTYSLTGVVKDETTQFPIAGATVNVTSGATSITTTTDANGAWAIANVPAQPSQTTITPPAPWGTFQSSNSTPSADTTYERTIDLTTEPQIEDEGNDTADLTGQLGESASSDAYSQTRVPPIIRVRMLNVWPEGTPNDNCKAKPGEPLPSEPLPYRKVRPFPLWYYLIRVAGGEVANIDLNQVGMKAFLSIAQNYAWQHKTQGGPFDVDNASNHYQCFRVNNSVDQRWHTWLNDVLDERVTKPSNRLLLTKYLGDPPEGCSHPNFPINGGTANQYVIKGLSERPCPRMTYWRDIVKYFYPISTQIKSGAKPFLPKTGVVHFPDHHLRVSFNSYFHGVNNGIQVVEDVAWSYRVVQRTTNGTFRSRHVVKPSGINAVPTHLDFSPSEASGTNRYYVRACNPVGCSQAAAVRDQNTGLDITG